jgi:hypothetical protein
VRCTLTKNTGTIKSAKITTAIMPPITLVPSACLAGAAAPVAITIGSTPQTKGGPSSGWGGSAGTGFHRRLDQGFSFARNPWRIR